MSRANRLLSLVPVVGWLCGLGFSVPAAGAQSGEAVYREVCAACHGRAGSGAPQLGDKVVWAPLFEESQTVVTAHGWVGARGMPPRGGRPELALDAFARATAYMARSAGGDWADPDDAMLARIRAEVVKRREELGLAAE